MGFGLLLIGYIVSYVAQIGFGPYVFAATLIGGFIMFLGLSELRKYAPTFVYAIIADTLLLICAIYGTLCWMESQLGLGLGIETLTLNVFFDIAQAIIDFVFNIALLYGIADLSRRVDYSDTRVKAYRNMIFVIFFNVVLVVVALGTAGIEIISREFMLLLMLFLQLFYSVMNAALIFKCYAMICPEGQEDMQRKPSRFEFINKWNKVQDEREEQVIESTKKYVEDKIRKRNEKLNGKNTSRKAKGKKK